MKKWEFFFGWYKKIGEILGVSLIFGKMPSFSSNFFPQRIFKKRVLLKFY